MSKEKLKERTEESSIAHVQQSKEKESEPESPPTLPREDTSVDEMDLDEAIGDVFNNILGNEEKNDKSSKVVDAPRVIDEETVSKPSAEENPTDAINLDAAIGDAFNDILGSGETDNKVEEQLKEITAKHQALKVEPTIDADSMDLDQAIGAAFEKLIDKDAQSTPVQEQLPANKDNIEEDIDLDAAIGDAFKIVLPQQTKDKSLPLPSDETDNALENAIGEAFKSLTTATKEDDHQPNDDDLNAMIAQSFQQALQAPRAKKSQQVRSEDMENAITQAFKSAMAANNVPQLTSREIVIRNLAVEISQQVQDHLKDDKFNPPLPFIPGLPQLDAGVLEHFQKEAYTDDNKESKRMGECSQLFQMQ